MDPSLMPNRMGQINEEKRKGPDIMGMTLTTRAMQENPASEGIYGIHAYLLSAQYVQCLCTIRQCCI